MKLTKRLLSLFLALSLVFGVSIEAWAQTLTLPAALESIEEEAFAGDKSLDKVALPDGLRSIGKRAFADSSVKEINFPDSLTSIAEDAFSKSNPTVTAQTENDAFQWAANHGMKTALIPALDEYYDFTMSLPVADTKGYEVSISKRTRRLTLSNWDLMRAVYGDEFSWTFITEEGSPELELSCVNNSRTFQFEVGNLYEMTDRSNATVKAVLKWGDTETETTLQFHFLNVPLPERVSFDQDIRMKVGETYRSTVLVEPADWFFFHYLYINLYDGMSPGRLEFFQNLSWEPEVFYIRASEPGYYLARPFLGLADNAAIMGDFCTISVLHGEDWYVEDKGLPSELAAVLASEPAYDGIAARQLTVEGIPLIEIYKNDGKPKPIVFILHGAGGNKNVPRIRELALRFATEGFYSVCIDLAACGDSDIGPIDAVTLFNMTASQLDILVEYYDTVAQADAAHFGLWGLSFGGIISFIYAAHGKYQPTIIAPVEATPDLETLKNASGTYPVFDHGGSNDKGPLLTLEELASFRASMQPMNQLEKLSSIYIYAGNRSTDELIDEQGCRTLKQLLNPQNDPAKKQLFEFYHDGAGHGAPLPEHYEKIHAAFKQVLLGAASGPFVF